MKTFKFPTPFAEVTVTVEHHDKSFEPRLAKEIEEWLKEQCGMPTEKDKLRFEAKIAKIRNLIKERKQNGS